MRKFKSHKKRIIPGQNGHRVGQKRKVTDPGNTSIKRRRQGIGIG